MSHVALPFNPSLKPTPHKNLGFDSYYYSSPRSNACVALASINGFKWSLQNGSTFSSNKSGGGSKSGKLRRVKEEDEEEEGVVGDERQVSCEVEVVSWRERRVKAEILVDADIGSVWTALTDYERLY